MPGRNCGKEESLGWLSPLTGRSGRIEDKTRSNWEVDVTALRNIRVFSVWGEME